MCARVDNEVKGTKQKEIKAVAGEQWFTVAF